MTPRAVPSPHPARRPDVLLEASAGDASPLSPARLKSHMAKAVQLLISLKINKQQLS